MIPYALASTAVAALISPIITGAMADRHYSAAHLLGYLSLATAAMLAVTFFAIERRWNSGLILALFQLQQLCSQPSGDLPAWWFLQAFQNQENSLAASASGAPSVGSSAASSSASDSTQTHRRWWDMFLQPLGRSLACSLFSFQTSSHRQKRLRIAGKTCWALKRFNCSEIEPTDPSSSPPDYSASHWQPSTHSPHFNCANLDSSLSPQRCLLAKSPRPSPCTRSPRF